MTVAMTLEERADAKVIADRIRERFGKDFLNAGEFAEYLGKSRLTVYAGIRSKHLPGQRYEHSYTIPAESIAIWETKLAKTKETESDY